MNIQLQFYLDTAILISFFDFEKIYILFKIEDEIAWNINNAVIIKFFKKLNKLTG